MKTGSPAIGRERVELAGDAALITAAVFAVSISIALLIALAVGDRAVPAPLQVLSALLVMLTWAGGPMIAWLVHRRPLNVPAVLGALLGGPVGGAVFFVLVGISQVLGWALSPFTGIGYIGPLLMAALVGLGFAALSAWLVADALRDNGGRREHMTLDLVRMASAATVAVFVGVIAVLAFGRAGPELAEAIAFMLMGAISAASIVTMADLVVGRAVAKAEATAPAEAG